MSFAGSCFGRHHFFYPHGAGSVRHPPKETSRSCSSKDSGDDDNDDDDDFADDAAFL